MRKPIYERGNGDSGCVLVDDPGKNPGMPWNSNAVNAAEAVRFVGSAEVSLRGWDTEEGSGDEEDDAAYALRANGRQPGDEAVLSEPSARVPYPGVYIMPHPISV